MSVATMANQHPPTPPEVEGHELQDGFHQLLQHNARSQHQPNGYSIDNASYIPSGNTYNTPEPELGQWFVDQYGNRSFMYHNQNNLGGDIQYVYKEQMVQKSQEKQALTKTRTAIVNQCSGLTKAACTQVCRSST